MLYGTYRVPIISMYKCVFLAVRLFFLFWLRVFSRALGSVARRELAKTPCPSLGPGRGPWHVLWGFKVARPLGEGFRAREHVEPSRPVQTHVQVKECPAAKMCYLGCYTPSMLSDNTYLMMEKKSPTPTCQTCDRF